MLQEVVEGQHALIDEEAQRKKQQAEYVAGVCMDHWQRLVEIYRTDDSELIFHETRNLIRRINDFFGMVGYDPGEDEWSDPLGKLGWIELHKINDDPVAYQVVVTKKGHDIYDGFLRAAGDSIDAMFRRRNRLFFPKLVAKQEAKGAESRKR